MIPWHLCLAAALLLPAPVEAVSAQVGNVVKLPATADIWLSDANEDERNVSLGNRRRFKLKSIQEMAAIRFDASRIRGREVTKAKLLLKPWGPHRMHYLRVSTVNQDWREGQATLFFLKADGATWWYASSIPPKHWAWKGSHFADVIMTSGNTLATWGALKEEQDGWISINLPPDLVYALIARDTDGLAVVDGGNLSYHNNFIYSRESRGRAPYVQVELGGTLNTKPAAPTIQGRTGH